MNLEWLQSNRQNILFECISGSFAYGTFIEGKSDKDIRGIFIVPQESLYGLDYPAQIADESNDTVYYELGRFCELLLKSNPNILELLNMPEDCILHINPLFKKYFIDNRQKFITKQCRYTFLAYAQEQIKKATGLNKKMNWEAEKVTRKTPLDFCYVPYNQGSIPLTKWLELRGCVQEKCGLVNVPNMRDTYSLFYDFYNENLGYKGIIKGDTSNEVCLSSIPKEAISVATMQFNKDGYSSHCKDYNAYQTWLEKRNTARFVDVENHGQMIDGKNMLHVMRLIDMSYDLLHKREIVVRRENTKELLDVRYGKMDLKELIKIAEAKFSVIDEELKNCDLPENVEYNYVNLLLKHTRIEYYGTL